jgi:hypothetical protein
MQTEHDGIRTRRDRKHRDEVAVRFERAGDETAAMQIEKGADA